MRLMINDGFEINFISLVEGIINIILKMEQLLNSRMSKEGSPTKLENLSPEKFGKAAYAGLSYTPSKLVDNVLYKEATSFKKI